MIPFLASSGGSFQDTSILVDVFAVREMLVGGRDGTAIKQLNNNFRTCCWGLSNLMDTRKNTGEDKHNDKFDVLRGSIDGGKCSKMDIAGVKLRNR